MKKNTPTPNVSIEPFFDPQSSTMSYVVYTDSQADCLVIDPVLNFDMSSGTVSSESADQIEAFIKANGLTLHTILETHAHADHLSSGMLLKRRLGGQLGIGAGIDDISAYFGPLYGLSGENSDVENHFDFFTKDGMVLTIGKLSISCLHVPGHTPACMAYLVGDALFVGDTLFMPDSGTARCDFPGGDAKQLYQSIRKLLSLPADTRVFVCHDYQPNQRELAYVATIAEHRSHNIHVNERIGEAEFVALRTARDQTLAMPALMLPSLQVNIRAGKLPYQKESGKPALTIPLNAFSGLSSLIEEINQ